MEEEKQEEVSSFLNDKKNSLNFFKLDLYLIIILDIYIYYYEI